LLALIARVAAQALVADGPERLVGVVAAQREDRAEVVVADKRRVRRLLDVALALVTCRNRGAGIQRLCRPQVRRQLRRVAERAQALHEHAAVAVALFPFVRQDVAGGQRLEDVGVVHGHEAVAHAVDAVVVRVGAWRIGALLLAHAGGRLTHSESGHFS
jgi:hypothetical protein